MKIIFLNIWKGVEFDALMDFIKRSGETADFFCFQEMTNSPVAGQTKQGGRTNMFTEISDALPGFSGYFARVSTGFDEERHVDYEIMQGQAIFAKKNIAIDSFGEVFVFGEKAAVPEDPEPENLPAVLQYMRFEKEGKQMTLATVHGIPYPGNKLDDSNRLEQSRRIISFFEGEKGEKILGGDFNMLPNTESMCMFEKAGMNDLIKAYGVTNTRNELAYGTYPEDHRQYFADFMFVSSGIQVIDFKVPYCLVSDHLPMILEVE